MNATTSVRQATPHDLESLSRVEVLAAQMYAPYGLGATSPETLTSAARLGLGISQGLLFCAETAQQKLVGWALAERRGEDLHLEEINVDPEYARQRIGSALLLRVLEEGRLRGVSRITLVTVDFVPWTLGFYAHHGFRALRRSELSEDLVKDLWIGGQDYAAHAQSFGGRVALVRDLSR